MTFSEIYRTITKKEWLFISIFAVLVIIVTLIPPLYARLNQPAGEVYIGIHYQNSGDWNVYYSYIEQIKQGHFLLKNSFTSEPQNRVFFNPVWIIGGLIARIFNLSSIISFQILRVICIPVFCFFAFIFISYFFKETAKRRICFLLLLFSGGFGQYSQLADGFTFLSLNFSPHLITALILIILTVLFLLLAWENNSIRYSMSAGICSLCLFIIQPFVVPTIYLVPFIFIFIYYILKKSHWLTYLKHYIILLLISLPAVIYYFYLINSDRPTQIYQMQNTLLSPQAWQYILAYGFLVILTAFGLKPILNSRENKNYFIVTWLLINIFLLYGPFNFQIRLVEGLHIPVVVISTFGLFYLYQLINKLKSVKQYEWLLSGFLVLLCLSVLPISSLAMLKKNINVYPKYYLDRQEYEAMIWLKNNTQEDEIILSNYSSGNRIAGLTGRTVYLGHGIQTINWEKKYENLKWFFSNNDNLIEREKFLKDNRIDYLFFGVKERNLGGFSPGKLVNLKNVYNNDGVSIYKFI